MFNKNYFRESALETDESFDTPKYYMNVAKTIANKSSDPHCKVGACIVNTKGEVVSVGYNRFPDDCDSKFTWSKGNRNPLDNKHYYGSYFANCNVS